MSIQFHTQGQEGSLLAVVSLGGEGGEGCGRRGMPMYVH